MPKAKHADALVDSLQLYLRFAQLQVCHRWSLRPGSSPRARPRGRGEMGVRAIMPGNSCDVYAASPQRHFRLWPFNYKSAIS